MRIAGSILAAAMLIVALAAPQSAHAWKRFYHGEVEDRGSIYLVLVRKHGDLRVRSISASSLPLHCASGFTASGEFEIRGNRVNRRRRFHVEREAEGPRASGIAQVDGTLLRGGRAVGTLRQFDEFDETPICDTGILEWEATVQPYRAVGWAGS